MKSKILTLMLAICFIVPCLLFVGCENHKHEWEVEYGYDKSGAYCQFIECDDCDEIREKTVIVEAVTETNAVLNGAGVTQIKYDEDNFDIGTTFNDAIAKLSHRCLTNTNTKFVKTIFDKQGEKPGLPLQGNIKLTEDILVGYNGNTTLCFHITGEVTIDLNGHTIRQQCGTDGMSGYALFVVRDGGKLNIIDSSAEHNGTISGVLSAIQINEGGEVNLYDGTVKCESTITVTDASEQYFCIWTIATNGGIFNQYGGKVTTVRTRWVKNETQHTATTDNYAFASYGAGEFNLYDGEVYGDIEDTAELQVNDMRTDY